MPQTVIPEPKLDPNSAAIYLLNATRESTWQPNIVILGDSIPYYWAYGIGAQSYASTFGPFYSADFALPGSRTQNVLWQIETGALQSHPKVAVLSVGINNLVNYDSVDDTIAGIVADVEAIRSVSPTTRVMLTGILPDGPAGNWLRTDAVLVNQAIATMADGNHLTFSDPGTDMIFPDGTINNNFLPDLTHPNLAGYEIWGSVILDTLATLLLKPTNR